MAKDEKDEFHINEKKNAVSYCLHAYGIEYWGSAKCSESDEFDINKGKALAKHRASLALLDDQIKMLTNTANQLKNNMADSDLWQDDSRYRCSNHLLATYLNDVCARLNHAYKKRKVLREKISELAQ